jgi:hypothetical protein
MTRKAPVIIVLLFVGIGLVVAGGIVLGTQTVISDTPAITCGSSITADDKQMTTTSPPNNSVPPAPSSEAPVRPEAPSPWC